MLEKNDTIKLVGYKWGLKLASRDDKCEVLLFSSWILLLLLLLLLFHNVDGIIITYLSDDRVTFNTPKIHIFLLLNPN